MKQRNILPVLWMLGIPLCCMILMLTCYPDQLDLRVSDSFYRPGSGFIGKHNQWLKLFLHDKDKKLVMLVSVVHALVWLASFVMPLKIERKRWLYVFLAMTLSTSIVTPLKQLTAVQCPWDVVRYGGAEQYTPLVATRSTIVKKAGECWPAGHAAAGFSLFALFFGWRDSKPRIAYAGLASALVLGTAFSVGRMVQGAHFLSHNLWTALIVWMVCAGLYWVMFPQSRPPPQLLSSSADYRDSMRSS